MQLRETSNNPSHARLCRPATNRVQQLARPLFEPASGAASVCFVSAVSAQDIGGWVSGLWRACHQAVLQFNRPYRGGIPAGQDGHRTWASKIRADCVAILGAETSLAQHYSSDPPPPASRLAVGINILSPVLSTIHTNITDRQTDRQTYHIYAQHEWQQDITVIISNQGRASPDNHLQAPASSSCRKVGCSSQRLQPRQRMVALRPYSALQTPNSPRAISQE